MSCVIDPALHLFVTTSWQLPWICRGPCEAPLPPPVPNGPNFEVTLLAIDRPVLEIKQKDILKKKFLVELSSFRDGGCGTAGGGAIDALKRCQESL